MPERSAYDLMTDDEVSDAIGVQKSTLYRMIAGKLFPPAIRVTGPKGKKRLWIWKDVESYLHLQSRMGDSEMPTEPPDDE